MNREPYSYDFRPVTVIGVDKILAALPGAILACGLLFAGVMAVMVVVS